MLFDTHCHIHESGYEDPVGAVARAKSAGVDGMICVGTDNHTSEEAVRFAENTSGVWASVGVHPHDTKDGISRIEQLLYEKSSSVVAVGEIGLDYFYTNSPRDVQIQAFEEQLALAVKYNVPVIFHVREAFDDFWPIFSNFSGLRGVLHSFTDTTTNMERAIAEGLYIGVNGISTFTKDKTQQAMFDAIPINRLVLETDAPFLTPTPHRGKVNEPAFVKHVAEYHAMRRKILLDNLARVTSANASKLFSLS